MNYYISKVIWQGLYQILTQEKYIHTGDEHQLRLFFEAVWYILKTGCQWRMLPQCYGKWRSVHQRFFRWCVKGIWDNLFNKIQQDPDVDWVMIDSTIVRAHPCAAGYFKNSQNQEALGRSVGGFSTKLHALVDALGNPMKMIATPGQSADITYAEKLLEDIEDTPVLADKGYDSDTFIENLKQKDCETIIPPRRNRKQQRDYDKHTYKERHLIECFFNKLKHFRRIFSRFEKTKKAFLAFVIFASILIWLR